MPHVARWTGWSVNARVISIFGDGTIIRSSLEAWAAFHATHSKNKQRFPGFQRPSALRGAVWALDGMRHTLGRHPSRTHTHTHTRCRTQQVGARARSELSDSAQQRRWCCWRCYSCERAAFEGKTNASAASSHFLEETVFAVVWCLYLLPCGVANTPLVPSRGCQTGKGSRTGLSSRDAPLARPSPGAVLLSHQSKKTKYWHTLV